MKKENPPSRAWKELQNGMVSNESLDCFESLVGAWWALRRVKRTEREMVDALERIVQVDAAIAANRTREQPSAAEPHMGEAGSASTSMAFSAQRQGATTERDGLLKYVVLYALTLLLRPIVTFVLSALMLWALATCCCGSCFRHVEDPGRSPLVRHVSRVLAGIRPDIRSRISSG